MSDSLASLLYIHFSCYKAENSLLSFVISYGQMLFVLPYAKMLGERKIVMLVLQKPADSIHQVAFSFTAHCTDFIFAYCFWLLCLADDDAPAKTPKVEIPPTQAGGVVQGPLGVGFPPQSTVGVMPTLYVSVIPLTKECLLK